MNSSGGGARPWSCIGIVGAGLIGGSIALAVRARRPDLRLVAYDIAPPDRLAAIVDEVVPTLRGLGACDVIFVAVPIAAVRDVLLELCPLPGAPLVTDVSSTKRSVMRVAAEVGLPSFVGGHPMAGSETAGLDAASARLFENRPWLLVEGSASAAARRDLEALIAVMGGVPTWMDAADHDRAVAYVSHLPQVLATTLMNTADAAIGRLGPAASGRAFGEMTRLASSPPSMWTTVLADNADFVAEALAAFVAELPGSHAAPGEWASAKMPRSNRARRVWLARDDDD